MACVLQIKQRFFCSFGNVASSSCTTSFQQEMVELTGTYLFRVCDERSKRNNLILCFISFMNKKLQLFSIQPKVSVEVECSLFACLNSMLAGEGGGGGGGMFRGTKQCRLILIGCIAAFSELVQLDYWHSSMNPVRLRGCYRLLMWKVGLGIFSTIKA